MSEEVRQEKNKQKNFIFKGKINIKSQKQKLGF